MASVILPGPKIDPHDYVTSRAEGALTANSFVKKGTTDDEVQPIATTDNEIAIGFVDRAYDDNAIISYLGSGSSIVECVADGTVASGDQVVTGDAVNSVKVATGDGTDNIVGMCVAGNTTGKTVQIRLHFKPATD